MRVDVYCYSGRTADERPIRFRLDEHEYMVEDILDQWYGPDHVFFKVRTYDGNVCILQHQTSEIDADWDLISFQGRG